MLFVCSYSSVVIGGVYRIVISSFTFPEKVSHKFMFKNECTLCDHTSTIPYTINTEIQISR